MTVATVNESAERAPRAPGRQVVRPASPPPKDLQRTFRLVLATVWLLDAALQLQPFMFTRGSNGFSGMLNGLAAGNPGVVYHSIAWNASNVYHYPILTNAIFASIQFLIAFGIVYKRTCKPALVLSIVWSIGVWWFGEGAGAVFLGEPPRSVAGPGASSSTHSSPCSCGRAMDWTSLLWLPAPWE